MENQPAPPTISTPTPQPSLPETSPTPQTKDKSKPLIVALVLLFLASAGLAGYFAYKNYQLKKEVQTPSPIISPPPASPLQPTETESRYDWATYTNSKFRFSFEYPKEFHLQADISSGDGLEFPFLQESFYENTNQVIKIQVKKLKDIELAREKLEAEGLEEDSLSMENYQELVIDGQKAIYYQGRNQTGQIEKTIIKIYSVHLDKYVYIRQLGDKQDYFDHLIETFKFLPNQPDKTTGFPQDYKECLENKSPEEKESAKGLKYECIYEVKEGEKEAFQACGNFGGFSVVPPCTPRSCGEDTGEICWLIFYNPDFIFPKNYPECRQTSGGGGKDEGGSYCRLISRLDAVYNREFAKKLVSECIKLGGKEKFFHGAQGCEIKYFE